MSAIFLLNLIAKINNLLIAEGETRLKFENHVTKWHSTLPSISLAEWNARCIAWIFECHNWKKHTQVKPSMEIPMKITWKYPWSWKFPCNMEIRRMPELIIAFDHIFFFSISCSAITHYTSLHIAIDLDIPCLRFL